MIDIEVQPHPDGVRRHEVIHLTRLIERHLSIPGARAKRPHDHRRAALHAADQLGNGIDVIHREPDNGRACGHPRNLARPGIAEL